MRNRRHYTRAAWREGRYGPWGDGHYTQWHEDALLNRPQAHRMSARARLLTPVVISFIIQLPPALYFLLRNHGGGGPIPVVILALAVIGPLALLGARRFPGPVVAVVTAAACADFLLADPQMSAPYLALAFAIGGAVARGARIWAWISVGIGWIVTLALGLGLGYDWHPARVAVTTLGILLVFGMGEAVRTRGENFEKYRKAVLQRRQTEVQAERVRIARELHDVLAHSLSQINVQASVGLHLMDKQPERAAEALASIKETSKTALDEVRSVLGVLRSENGEDLDAPLVPEPDLSRLTGLAASVTSQGVEVTLDNGVEDAPKAVQLALYRIVQESLTNVVRHAKATRASVTISADEGDIVVRVADNGTGLPEGRGDAGRGLLGMRERAELLGGSLETGTGPEGGLLVTARIPRKDSAE